MTTNYRTLIETGAIDRADAVAKIYPERAAQGHPIIYPWEDWCSAEDHEADDDCRLVTGKGQHYCYPCWLKNV
jgi:hypothetical protein